MMDDSSHETRDSQDKADSSQRTTDSQKACDSSHATYDSRKLGVRHYYHAYAAGAWSQPVREHFEALSGAGLRDMDLTVGLIGQVEDRERCWEIITHYVTALDLPEPVNWLEAEYGWEQLTLQQVHLDVHQVPGEFAVLYMHTKGAHNNTDGNARWRQSMTRYLVGRWGECVQLLDQGYDAVGCHWVKAPQWPEQPPFFAGNFWWARASFLRTLAPPDNETRWQPETWISYGDPKIYDLRPCWPDYGDP